MAGKFLSLQESAERLGASEDEVLRLVDRKELYPLRDGNTLKFREDEIEKVAAEREAAAPGGTDKYEELELEIDAAASGVGGSAGLSISLDLGDSLPPAADVMAKGSGSGDAATPSGDGDALELDGDEILGAPLPEAALSGQTPPAAVDKSRTATLKLDLDDIALPGKGGSNASGLLAATSGPNAIKLSGSLPHQGSALSGPIDEGLSLEDSDAKKSGFLSPGQFDVDEDEMRSAIEASAGLSGQSGLAGEDLEEFDPVAEEEAGSDVIADESGAAAPSSFLEDDGSSSVFPDDSSQLVAGGAAAFEDLTPGVDLVRDTTFSVWQICGLVCCALLMLTSGFVMFDLVRTLGSPDDLVLSSPLVNPMAQLFGWRP